jgi:hypothetical protein
MYDLAVHCEENRIIVAQLNFNNIGIVSLCMYKNEDSEPHFHIENGDGTFNACICIYLARYCLIGSKNKDMLTDSQVDKLDLLLHTKCDKLDSNSTYWNYIDYLWKRYMLNDEIQFYYTEKCPDYQLLKKDDYDSEERIHSRENKAFICKVNLDGLRELYVRVYADEDVAKTNGFINVPHFHLENEDKSFMSCICLYESKYFNHGFKTIDTLNELQKEQLNNALKMQSNIPSCTNWYSAMSEWEVNYNYDNDNVNPKYTDIQPDYTQMTEIIGG